MARLLFIMNLDEYIANKYLNVFNLTTLMRSSNMLVSNVLSNAHIISNASL